MGKQGVPMTEEDRLKIIKMYNEDKDMLVKEFEERTGFSETTIRDIIEDYRNRQIDAKGYYKNISISVKDGKIIEKINPVEFIEKE